MNKVDYEENGWHSPTDRFFLYPFLRKREVKNYEI